MGGVKNFIISFVLVAVFSMSLITFGIQTGIDNNSNLSIADDPRIQSFNSSLYSTSQRYDGEVNGSGSAFYNSPPTTGSEGLQILSIPSIVKTLITTPLTIYQLTFGFVIDTIFGSNPIFDVIFTMLGGLVVGIGLLYSWKLVRSGSPD